MTLLGKLICAARKLLRVKKVHDYKRRNTPFGDARVCRRCGDTVQVKPRLPRKPRKQETEK